MNSRPLEKLNKEHIRRQFDRSAPRYDDVAQMQAGIVTDLLVFAETLTTPLIQQKSPAIIDVGCGTGYGLQALAAAYPHAQLSGLDIAPSMLKVARERQPNANFELGDIERLPYGDNQFDLTWSSSAIQWCDTVCAANELARITKIGGQLLVSTFSLGTLADWRALWGQDSSSQRFEAPEVIESAFISAGLENVRIKNKTYKQTFTSFRSAVNSIRDLGAGNAEQSRSQGLFGVSLYKAIEAKVEKVITEKGVLELPYNVAFIVASKGA